MKKDKLNNHRCRAILFDFDGTLVDLEVNWKLIRDEIKKLFLSYELRQSSDDTLLDSIKKSYYNLKKYNKQTDDFFQCAFNIIKKGEAVSVKSSKLMPGARVLLKWLQEKNIPVAIVSNNDSDCIKKCIKKFNLPNPAIIVGRDSVNSYKPEEEPALVALKALGLKSRDCWYIGNSECDLDFGRNSKITTFILSNNSFRNKKVNKNLYLIKNLLEFKELIIR